MTKYSHRSAVNSNIKITVHLDFLLMPAFRNLVVIFPFKRLVFFFLQEVIIVTLAAAASHSEIPTTFSGNSSAAVIRLRPFLVSPFLFKSGEALTVLHVSLTSRKSPKRGSKINTGELRRLTWIQIPGSGTRL